MLATWEAENMPSFNFTHLDAISSEFLRQRRGFFSASAAAAVAEACTSPIIFFLIEMFLGFLGEGPVPSFCGLGLLAFMHATIALAQSKMNADTCKQMKKHLAVPNHELEHVPKYLVLVPNIEITTQ